MLRWQPVATTHLWSRLGTTACGPSQEWIRVGWRRQSGCGTVGDEENKDTQETPVVSVQEAARMVAVYTYIHYTYIHVYIHIYIYIYTCYTLLHVYQSIIQCRCCRAHKSLVAIWVGHLKK